MLLNFALKVLPFHQIWYIVIVLVLRLASLSSVLFLQALIALRQLAQGGQGVRTKLVENAGDEFGELFVFARTVNGKSVRRNGGVD